GISHIFAYNHEIADLSGASHTSLKFAFLIFKYFPYGGQQRDMLRIATELSLLGHSVDVFTMAWVGEPPASANINIRLVPAKGLLNHRRYANFIRAALIQIAEGEYDLVTGFNRMPGLDAYFAADPCFVEKAYNQRNLLYRFSGRYRWFAGCEQAIFSPESRTEVLLLAEREKTSFQQWYRTPDERFHLLPPYLSSQRMALQDKGAMRQRLRQEFGFDEDDFVLLLVGSGFRTKGLDRAIDAVAALPAAVRAKTRLVAVGQDNPKVFKRLVLERGLKANVRICAGRDDIPELMQGADLLIHPARRELAGHVLLEAMASGLPVLATDVCGYSPHIQKAQAGKLLKSPFQQTDLNAALLEILSTEEGLTWSRNGLQYAKSLMAANDGSAEAQILVKLAQRKQLPARTPEEPYAAVL
ncbi:MAG TPA: glycosyltransferase family 4 protein, partial [Methylophilaceae bacterium]|nr:glycosyltransferase family 4 protein [Methylophilaceae bacterium]